MDKPIEYEQTDSRWRNIMYSSIGNRADTIGNSGCGPTCAAMVVATLRDRKITPKEAAAWSVAKGYLSPHDGTYWSYFKAYLDTYKIKCTQTASDERALTALNYNRMVITSMGKGLWTSGGHFILAYGVANGKVKIHDPNSEASYRELGDLKRYQSEAVQYWIIEEAWKVDVKSLNIKDLDRNKTLTVQAVNVDDTNYVKLRDLEKLAPVVIDYDGVPTIRLNYKG